MKIGDLAPDFSLSAVDGRTYSLKDFSDRSVLVVVFSCNHCPYVQAYEDRLIAFQRDYQGRGVRLIAINSNDDKNYPEDRFENMVSRSNMKGYNFPYLRDASQEVARAFGATHTPQLFVFNRERRLAYTGKIDDNWRDASSVTRCYLREAVEALLEHREPEEATSHAIGCTIKWASTVQG